MKTLLIILFAAAVYAQPEYRAAQKNPDAGYTYEMLNDGTNVVTLCKAQSLQPTSASISIASATNASPVVFTVSGGHGLSTKSRPLVTISSGTGNWTAVNGTFTATPINTTTFSIAVDSTAFGAVAGTLVFTTRAPRLTQSIWSVAVYTWSGSIPTGTFWYNGSPGSLTTCSAAPTQYQ